jgi:hypothetical protein
VTKLPTSIVSGSASGAERGGLDAAIALDLGWGGWARMGWVADDGVIPEIYRDRMRQSSSPERGMVIRLNIQDSDGTLLLSFGTELVASAAFTAAECDRQRKAFLHLVLPAGDRSQVPDTVRREVIDWITEDGINVLNIAGPLEREEPSVQAVARDALVWIFEDEV